MFYLHHLFRSFLPLHNPIGFGTADFLELFTAAMLVALALLWPRFAGAAQGLAQRKVWCIALLFVLPIALRLALLGTHPIPEPAVADDFGYALLGDTLAHFRLTNPPHPLHRFFETLFVLQEPTYSSIYPLGPGLALAFGRVVFGHQWAGIACSIGAMCALCYWMLRAWVTPGWALVGGALAVIEFGPLSQWMNSYWGGAVSAIAGCLALGALPRLRKNARVRDAVILGAGLGLEVLSRPFESIFLILACGLYLLPVARQVLRLVPAIAAAALPALGLMLLHNQRVTGHWLTLPYAMSRYQYGVPAAFTFQPNVRPHRELTRAQQLDYQAQSLAHGNDPDTVPAYLRRLVERARFYRFFFITPLYVAIVAFLFTWREDDFVWICITLAIFALGTNVYPYFFSHYLSALTCLFVLVSLRGLQKLGPIAGRWLLFICVAQFGLWYTVHMIGDPSLWQFETWDAINYGDPGGRIGVNRELAGLAGKQLVFVRYGPQHTFKEWVYNAAEIDAAKVVWARDLGPAEDEKLRRYYPDRTAWLIEPDARPIHLEPYAPPPPELPPPNPSRPHLKLEEVH